MALEFRMPDVGEGLAEGEIQRWLVDVGAEVALDEPFVEIETDKAVMELPAPRSGVLLFQAGPEGTTIQVGDLLAVIGDKDEVWTGREPASDESPPIVGSLASVPDEIPPSGSPDGRPQAAPPVRRFAEERGVDLRTVRGSGPNGRILQRDVELALAGADSAPEERVKLTGRRRAIADHMVRSWTEIPHVTTFESIDVERLMEARQRLTEDLGVPLPLEALLIKAVLPVLRELPEFNASVTEDEIVYKRTYNIGFSVDAPGGLVVPVVHDADRYDLRSLAGLIGELTGAARDRSLSREALSGLTFTVSNVGAVGGGFGTPLIPYGTTAILSVGRAREEPVVRNHQIEVGLMMPVSLSYDHRVIDGGTGRRFIAMLSELLQDPELFLGAS